MDDGSDSSDTGAGVAPRAIAAPADAGEPAEGETPSLPLNAVFRPEEGCDEVDALLRASMIGFEFDRAFEDGRLPDDHPFSWASFEREPKGDKGEQEHRGSWYKTMKYHCLHTGGFVRLCTVRGRSYWNAQNETGHRTPDWKLHFSCELDDLGRAWDIVAALFMEMKAEIGMKAVILDEGQWSEGQRGREITVYIYKFSHNYRGYMQGVVPEMDHEFFLGPEQEIYRRPSGSPSSPLQSSAWLPRGYARGAAPTEISASHSAAMRRCETRPSSLPTTARRPSTLRITAAGTLRGSLVRFSTWCSSFARLAGSTPATRMTDASRHLSLPRRGSGLERHRCRLGQWSPFQRFICCWSKGNLGGGNRRADRRLVPHFPLTILRPVWSARLDFQSSVRSSVTSSMLLDHCRQFA
jgi:hypothetical protein